MIKTTSSPLIFKVSPAVACPLITVPLVTLGISLTNFKKIATPVSFVVKSPEPSTFGYIKSPAVPGKPGTKSITPFAEHKMIVWSCVCYST